ncbi:MAG: glycoside hydrolase family 127 protein [Deltaproteobacteria bacterium]|nr:glycoside hydrolase family 127 protein [Deltaproteobacteria bacterium]
MSFFSILRKRYKTQAASLPNDIYNLNKQLDKAIKWIKRAQAVTPDDGVAQAFFVKLPEWKASYPETTGYIIPTMFDFFHLTGENVYREAAEKMANWECEVQLADGAVRAGTIEDNLTKPTIFNTGQVLFGWARAYEETKNERYLNSLARAADWLCDVQDNDGAWRKFGSTKTKTSLNTYNTRTAWGLIEAHKVTGNERYSQAAGRNLDWALTQQLTNGWWENNCLTDNKRPFTHTIAYAMRGFLEVGDFLKEDKYIEAALKAARALLKKQKRNGSWAGQFNRKWKAKCRWSCLTGNSQLAVNFIRLFEITGERKFFESAQRANLFNMSIQDIQTDDPNILGGIPGSWPIDGYYHPYQYPNWAAKFFADALMAELRHRPEKIK